MLLSFSALAEEYTVYHRDGQVMGTIIIENEKAELIDWGMRNMLLSDLEVVRSDKQIKIKYSSGCNIILSEQKIQNEFKYDFCSLDLGRKDYARLEKN